MHTEVTIAGGAADHPRIWRRWFAFLAGGVAWTFHLLSIYAIGEFGCVSGLGRVTYGGVSAVAWLILGASALALAVAAAAAWVGYRDKRRDDRRNARRGRADDARGGDAGRDTRRRPRDAPRGASRDDPRGDDEGGEYLSWFGAILSGLFTLIILVETLPVFSYLDGC
ncbi:MAG: hypothetical protein R6X25_14780 [Candidatus Krumholzibacteriia bacterium]